MALQKKETWKLKKWYSVYAPAIFNSALVGEMPANDDGAAVGRSIKVSLDALTHNPSHAYTNVVLKITGVNGSSASTKLVSMEQLYSYIRSLVRRYKSVATLVRPAKTKDNVSMVVKLLLVTRSRTNTSKIAGLRKEAASLVDEYFAGNDSPAIISAILENKLQSELASRLDHIAPLSKVEVRKLELSYAS